MRVVHLLLGKANPDRANGVNKVVHHLASEAVALSHDTEVWGITSSPSGVSHRPPYNLRLFRRTPSRFLLDRELVAAIEGLNRAETIVHLHSVFVPEFLSITRRLRVLGIPWVLTPHGGYSVGGLRRKRAAKLAYLRVIERSIIDGASRIHVLGHAEELDLSRMAPGKRLSLVPNGCWLEAQPARFHEGMNSTALRFVFCGRLDQNHKGLDTAIDAFARYVAKGGNGSLHIIGDGRDRQALVSRASVQGVAGRVQFHGALFGQQKLEELRRGHAFIHLSRWDGMPLACLEAAALGLPLVVTKETNLADYVKRWGAGEAVTSRDVDTVASSMLKIDRKFEEGALPLIGRAALEMVKTDFHWTNVYRALVAELYRPSLREI